MPADPKPEAPKAGSPEALGPILGGLLRAQGNDAAAWQVEAIVKVASAALAKLKAEQAAFNLDRTLAAREGWEERDDAAEAEVRRALVHASDDLESALVDLYGDEARDLEFEREVEAVMADDDEDSDDAR